MKSAVMILALFALVLILPLASFADTYVYVNNHGNLSTVVANTAAEALKIPLDIDAHSGVLLLTPSNNLGFRMQVTTATATVMVMPSTSSSTMLMVVPMTLASTTIMNQGGSVVASSSMMNASSSMSASSTNSTPVR